MNRTARTATELRAALQLATERDDSVVFIEVVTDAHDIPPLLAAIDRRLAATAATASAGPRLG
ncbi:hypothetical protein [Rathayibacter sp. VKM Ac-2760]|uniref:hypothetical protein n=1 Tax=Rathayibacter sp. VKM Ac-2760 TaxID=2609253 RepID=UPI0013190939|nr:hypothetical protein [Rathayibacter sp. VKM Ac-2760]QHC61204.1 hypothetical protein GSU72_21015 [Rathayibacter sp. VKM Ac-2760]